MDYKNAGVDIEAGYKSVELMKQYVKRTMRPEVLGGLGGFSGAFDLSAIKQMDEPVLLSGRMAWVPKSSWRFFWTNMTPSASTALPCASTTWPAPAASRCFF